MKVLILSNNLPFTLTDDVTNVTEYFKTRLPFPLTFTYKEISLETPIKMYKMTQGYDSQTGAPSPIAYYGLDDSVKEKIRSIVVQGEYQIVIFAWNVDTAFVGSKGAITSWTNFTPLHTGTEYIQLAVNPYIKSQWRIWKIISHEIMHALNYAVNHLGYPVADPMDSWKQPSDFVENDNPYSLTGNYAEALKRLKPYLPLLEPTKPVESTLPTATIIRKSTNIHTTGVLTATRGGATFICKTLELKWLNNQKNVSCIPPGIYKCKFTRSIKFPLGTYELSSVPNRGGIRIHKGNYAAGKVVDIQGCILLGNAYSDINKDGIQDIVNSTITMKAFEGFMGKRDFVLTIK